LSLTWTAVPCWSWKVRLICGAPAAAPAPAGLGAGSGAGASAAGVEERSLLFVGSGVAMLGC
jgi:hypothetical protein